VLEELSSALAQLGRLAETVAARLSRGDSAADWLPQLSEQASRAQRLFHAADEDTRAALRDALAETAELVRLAAACGDEWLSAHRQELDADLCAARLRRAYGLDAELVPFP
jgi:hypothetical protein